MILIHEDGSGKTDANSYCTVAQADTYHEGHLYAADWSAATVDTRTAALVMATRLIDAYFRFRGFRGSEEQALEWPRTYVPGTTAGGEALEADKMPPALVNATAETARELIKTDRTAAPEGEGMRQLELFEDKSVTYDPTDRRPVIPQVAQAMLSRLGTYIEDRSATVPLERA